MWASSVFHRRGVRKGGEKDQKSRGSQRREMRDFFINSQFWLIVVVLTHIRNFSVQIGQINKLHKSQMLSVQYVLWAEN